MIVIRRELPQSSAVGQHENCAPHSNLEDAPDRCFASRSSTLPSILADGCLRYLHCGIFSGNRPDESGQLTGHGHDGDLPQFIAMDQAPESAVKPILSSARDLHHAGRAAVTPPPDRRAGGIPVAIAPRSFHKHASQVGVACFSNTAAPGLVPAAVFRANQSREFHVASRVWKPAEVLGFHHDRHGAQRVDAFETAQRPHQCRIRRGLGQLEDLAIQALETRLCFLQGAQVGVEGLLGYSQVKALLAQPNPMPLAPRSAVMVEAPLAKEKFAQSVSRSQTVGYGVFAGSDQIPRRFLFARRDADFRSARRRDRVGPIFPHRAG